MPSGIYQHHNISGLRPHKKGEYKPTEETKKKMSENHRKYQTEETKKKISEAKKGKPNFKLRGKEKTEEHRRKISLALGGTGIPQRTTKRYYHLRDKKYLKWRNNVFTRDNWTCQTCGKRGCYLEPHHIKGWAKYPNLRYEVSNGVSLCKECHLLTRKKNG